MKKIETRQLEEFRVADCLGAGNALDYSGLPAC